jgi:acyl-CoA thioesterase FadM
MLIADTLELGLIVVNLGRTSVTYRVGIFRGKEAKLAAAVIDFTHAYVHPNTRKSIDMPECARRGFEKVLVKSQEKAKL